MQKICSWLWRPVLNGPQQEDSFWWDGENVLLSRAGEAPALAWFPPLQTPITGVEFLEKLSRKNYERLMPNMKALFDFLNATIGE